MSTGTDPYVVIVGSMNLDVTVTVTDLPRPGQTVLATGQHRAGGGKGGNQAVAAARAGGVHTSMVGAVGNDPEGSEVLDRLGAAGVDTATVSRLDDLPTGIALITVDAHAENSIVVAAGANAGLAIDDGAAAAIAEADVVLAQLEIEQQAVVEAAPHRRDGVPLLLNAAPSATLLDELVAQTDILIVNEGEAADVAGIPVGTTVPVEAVEERLLERFPAVLTTLGSQGARLRRRGQDPITVATPKVEAVDTTGAGDTFCGVFAAALARGASDAEALRAAAAASALSVQRLGAQEGVPTRAETDALSASDEF